MTESEALEKHKEDCRRCKDKACERNIQCLQKKDIEVYEEIQQYRAIGTVSEFQELKEKKHDCDIKHLFGECSYAETGCSDCIGKLKIKELLEKATGKKPIDVRYFAEAGYSIGLCPTCNSGINSEFKYCGDCCQCLDWSEGKE